MSKSKRELYLESYLDPTRRAFIERELKTENATDSGMLPFILFPRQIEFLNSLAYEKNTIAIKHRQAGITTVTSAWVTGEIVFCKKDNPHTVLCIGNRKDIACQLIDKIVTFAEQVPRWYWGPEFYNPDPNHPNNKKSIFVQRNQNYAELFNGCKIYARSSGKHAARGISAVSILILDEAAFIQDGVAVYAQAAAATSSVPNAKIIMVSTPHGKDALYYTTYVKAQRKENNFNAVEFKWFQDLRYNRNLRWKKVSEDGDVEYDVDPVIDERGNIVYNEERWRRMEADGWKPESPWYLDFCMKFNNDPQYIAQEIELSFLGSVDTVVETAAIEMQSRDNVINLPDDWSLKDPMLKETWIWKDPIPGHRYIIACDNSTGSSKDNTCIQIIDIDAVDEETGEPYYDQVLEYYGKLRPDFVGELVDRYGRMYNDALAVVEDIGGYGSATLIKLQDLHYPNLYYDQPALRNFTSQGNGKFTDVANRPGFHSSHLRMQMISNFSLLLSNNTFRVRSSRVIGELETWIFVNGRPNHMKGSHDDALMCLAMGLFVAMYYMIKKEKEKVRDKQILKSWLNISPNTLADNYSKRDNTDTNNKPSIKTMWKCGIIKL